MKNDSAQLAGETSLPRRTFLRNSLLVAIPLAAAGTPLAFAAGYSATSAYSAPTRLRGSTRVNVRDFGAQGNGSHDDTKAFQTAIDALPSSGGTVFVPAGTYVIDPVRRVNLRSNMHMQLSSDATLVAKSNSADISYVLMVYKVSNVEISGGRIVGDRHRHLGSVGERGHAIMVRGASRVTIRDIHLSDCWGDGICIGGAHVENQPTVISDAVVIANVVSTGQRRHGLTIGRSRNVKVYDSEFSNCRGLDFACGIDIEPGKEDLGTASNIHIQNCLIKGNQANGILVYKRVTGVTITKSTISNNGGYGIHTISPVDGYIAQNKLDHNYLMGVMLRTSTVNYQVSGNTFRNNHTRMHGVKNTTTAGQSIVGLIGGNKGNGAHIQVSTDCSRIRVTTNTYAA